VSFSQLVHNYGYLVVAIGVGSESVGFPLPGETILIAAATFAATTHRLSVPIVVLLAALSAIAGDNIGFGLARFSGARLLVWVSRHFRRTSRALTLAQREFERRPGPLVVFGRFISGIRTYTAFLAGVSPMRWTHFARLNAVASVLWASVIGFGSAALGSAFGSTFSYGAIGLAITAGALYEVVRRRRQRDRARLDIEPGSRAEIPNLPAAVSRQNVAA
jgi:membrane protein DedA with SNARE-associated domain